MKKLILLILILTCISAGMFCLIKYTSKYDLTTEEIEKYNDTSAAKGKHEFLEERFELAK